MKVPDVVPTPQPAPWRTPTLEEVCDPWHRVAETYVNNKTYRNPAITLQGPFPHLGHLSLVLGLEVCSHLVYFLQGAQGSFVRMSESFFVSH